MEFFRWLKRETERCWSEGATFSFPRHTTWRPGLDTAAIASFERAMGHEFPPELRAMLSVMNGTWSPEGEDVLRSPRILNQIRHVYSYPHDLEDIHGRVAWACEGYEIGVDDLERRGIPRLQPMLGHRYLVVTGPRHPVLSIHGRDTIVYGASLRSYLLHELLEASDPEAHDEDMNQQVAFWLDEADYAPIAPDDVRDKLPRS